MVVANLGAGERYAPIAAPRTRCRRWPHWPLIRGRGRVSFRGNKAEIAAHAHSAAGDGRAVGPAREAWRSAMGHTQSCRPPILAFDGWIGTATGGGIIWGETIRRIAPGLAAALSRRGRLGDGAALGGIEVAASRRVRLSTWRTGEIERMDRGQGERRSGSWGSTGRRLPDHGAAAVLLPAGHEGDGVSGCSENFAVIGALSHTADSLCDRGGHLADRIAGGDPGISRGVAAASGRLSGRTEAKLQGAADGGLRVRHAGVRPARSGRQTVAAIPAPTKVIGGAGPGRLWHSPGAAGGG